MSHQPSNIITRKARIWPEISKETINIPPLPNIVTAVNPIMLITIFMSMAGMATYAFIFSRINPGMNSLFFVGLLAMSGFMALGTVANFLFQWIPARRRKKYARIAYQKKRQEIEKQLITLDQQERQGRIELDPPFVLLDVPPPDYNQLSVVPIIQRSFNNQDIHLWARRPDDPDFLSVRIGMGSRPPSFKLNSSGSNTMNVQRSKFTEIDELIEKLFATYTSLRDTTGRRFQGHSADLMWKYK